MTDSTSFSPEYFRTEAMHLRDLWGTRDFWEQPGAASAAAKALGYVYLRTTGLTPSDKILWEATITELSMRDALLPEARLRQGW